ncbi:unnamed protein product [Microthlaspi erraticum]|uniref:Reverse transcriptase zinc-binding domain-containing protein n=1 Tax=Microthlaspi erraticum TaxID=1685480 RepID=A0A6D2IRQ2_9BRAS|nr:unnamed protein product [Microthlaspi erraticum]
MQEVPQKRMERRGNYWRELSIKNTPPKDASAALLAIGLNSQSRQDMAKAWIISQRPLFGAFTETHISISNSSRVLSAIPRGWRVSLVVYKETAQCVTCGIFLEAEQVSFTVSFVYAMNLRAERETLWSELVDIDINTPLANSPWAMVGDFNQILRGLLYSWSNRQDSSPVSKRIDHALTNDVWVTAFPDAFSELLEPLLDTVARESRFGLHPQCENPLITHLLFADDLLDFSEGSETSMEGIKEVLDQFKVLSGLDMNAAKSEVFFSGYSDSEAAALSSILEVKVGSFPTRYLELPLNSQRLSIAVLEPFLEKIRKKLHSYTVKFLSFAGKIKLVSSVFYGMVNFSSQVYMLPKEFYSKVDSLCSAFLWRNGTQSAVGARVAWKEVCKPKCEGGLGIRFLSEFEVVFRLKQAWNLFTKEDSLWIAWVRQHIFARKSFWVTNDAARFSKSIRSLLQIKPLLASFLRCRIQNGKSASFWWDAWTELGPLIDFIGTAGPRLFRLRSDAKVSEAVRNGSWNIPSARSERSEELQILLTGITPPLPDSGRDTYLWRLPGGSFSEVFSSKETWEQLRVASPRVNWFPTKDRLIRWGMTVSDVCPLCSVEQESHQHLFFSCTFSREVWLFFVSRIGNDNPPHNLTDVVDYLLHPPSTRNRHSQLILKLLFQQIVYAIWRERNARIFTTTTTPAVAIKRAVDRAIRDRLLMFPSTDSTSSLRRAIRDRLLMYQFAFGIKS